MKLVSLNDHPDWIKVFSELHLRFLKVSDQKYFISPEKIQHLLKLDFNVPKEAFFFEDETGEFFGGIFLTGSPTSKDRGHFSLFSYSEDERYQKLFPEIWGLIEKWFRDYGIQEIVGPYLYTSYFPYRFRQDHHPEKYIWEPNQPLFYNELVKAAGLKVDQTYYTNFMEDLGIFRTKGDKELEWAISNGYKFRPLNKEQLKEELKIIYSISMEGFKDNYLFTPIPYELFEKIYAPSFLDMDLRLSCIQEDNNGKPIGFNFTFPLDDIFVIKSAAVLPEHRGKGLFNAGVRWAMLEGLKFYPEINTASTALVHVENAPTMKISRQSEKFTTHEYALYRKELK